MTTICQVISPKLENSSAMEGKPPLHRFAGTEAPPAAFWDTRTRFPKKTDLHRAQQSHDKSLANYKPRGRLRRRALTRGLQPAAKNGRLPATPPYRFRGVKTPAPLFGKQYTRNVGKCKEVLAIFVREWYTFFILLYTSAVLALRGGQATAAAGRVFGSSREQKKELQLR